MQRTKINSTKTRKTEQNFNKEEKTRTILYSTDIVSDLEECETHKHCHNKSTKRLPREKKKEEMRKKQE
jgi:hypothetical protein